MKIIRYNADQIGVVKDDHVIDISALIPHIELRGGQNAMEDLISHFDQYKPAIADLMAKNSGVPLSQVRVLPPLVRPARVMAAFANYLDDPSRTKESVTLEFFHKCSTLIGPGGKIELPDIPQVKVYQAEAELAFVIGKAAHRVSEAEAMDHVFGYLPFYDVSARGLNRRSQLVSKGQETFAACGPWITTADEIADPFALTVKSWIAGTLRQDYQTKFMAHSIAAQIAWLSQFVHLRPGDVIATGVYHEGLWPINVGDTIEIEISGLGRASFNVAGTSAFKHVEFRPGGGGGGVPMTRV